MYRSRLTRRGINRKPLNTRNIRKAYSQRWGHRLTESADFGNMSNREKLSFLKNNVGSDEFWELADDIIDTLCSIGYGRVLKEFGYSFVNEFLDTVWEADSSMSDEYTDSLRKMVFYTLERYAAGWGLEAPDPMYDSTEVFAISAEDAEIYARKHHISNSSNWLDAAEDYAVFVADKIGKEYETNAWSESFNDGGDHMLYITVEYPW